MVLSEYAFWQPAFQLPGHDLDNFSLSNFNHHHADRTMAAGAAYDEHSTSTETPITYILMEDDQV